MKMVLVDTHTHLYDEAFDADRDEAVARAAAAGVGRMLLPAIDSRYNASMFALCGRFPERCFPMAGLHPTSVNELQDWKGELDEVERLLRERPYGRIYGVGEVGLDFYWSREKEKEQLEAFAAQIELALRFGLPLAVHTRDAWPEMLEILGAYRGRGLRGVMHALSEEDYRAVRKTGDFMFGIGGGATFKNSAVARVLPLMSPDDILLETDSPYLAPVPHRGKRNESAYLNIICDRAARLLGTEPERLAAVTVRNAERMFGIPVDAAVGKFD